MRFHLLAWVWSWRGLGEAVPSLHFPPSAALVLLGPVLTQPVSLMKLREESSWERPPGQGSLGDRGGKEEAATACRGSPSQQAGGTWEVPGSLLGWGGGQEQGTVGIRGGCHRARGEGAVGRRLGPVGGVLCPWLESSEVPQGPCRWSGELGGAGGAPGSMGAVPGQACMGRII